MKTLTPGAWHIIEKVYPSQTADWDDRLRRLAWVHPHDCYRVRFWRDWWLIYRFRRNPAGQFYVSRWSRTVARRLGPDWKRVARRAPLPLRLGKP